MPRLVLPLFRLLHGFELVQHPMLKQKIANTYSKLNLYLYESEYIILDQDL